MSRKAQRLLKLQAYNNLCEGSCKKYTAPSDDGSRAMIYEDLTSILDRLEYNTWGYRHRYHWHKRTNKFSVHRQISNTIEFNKRSKDYED